MVKPTTSLAVPDQRDAERQLAPLLKRANEIVIRTDADYQAAAIGMQKADAFLASALVGAFKKHAADAGAVHKQAVALRDRFMRGAQEVKRILSEKRVAYATIKQKAEERRRGEEAERLRLQQIEEAKKEAKSIRREDPEAAKELVEAAKAAPAPSLPVRAAVPKQEGFVTKTTYGFEVEKPDDVPLKYWSIDESLIRKDVNNFGLDANIPGVRVWELKKEHTRQVAT